MKLCKCGCEDEVTKEGNEYINGHNVTGKPNIMRGQKNIKNSLALKGKSHSVEHNQKISLGITGEHNPRWNPNKHIIETRTCICGCNQTFECPKSNPKKYIRGHNTLGKKNLKASKTLKGKSKSLEMRQKLKKFHQNPKEREKRSQKGRELWKDLLYRERNLKAIFKGLNIHPNKPETVLSNLLQQIYPNEWKFVGDGSVLIGFKSPDFININGKKQVIEMYGDYWHKKEVDSGRGRIKHFKKYGFDCLIIWERELKDLERIVEKINDFVKEK